MLLEFDADQRLWQETVRDAVAKQCPASLVRSIAEDGVDPTPLWKTYVDAGWTELTDPENAVELAIVLEELGRATDPTPFLATLTQFAPLAGDRFDPQQAGTAVYSGVTRAPRRRWLGARRHGASCARRRPGRAARGRHRSRRVRRRRGEVVARRSPVFDPVLHIAEVSFAGVRIADDRLASMSTRRQARHVALTGMAITTVGACQRILDLVLEHVKQRQQFGVAIGIVPGSPAQGRRHARRHRARPRAVVLRRADDRGRRSAQAAGRGDGQGVGGGGQAVVFRHGLQLFGAMGFTWENDLQFALKRAKAGELLLGGAAEHRAMIAEEFRCS